MKINIKKFQIINVGAVFMSDEYEKKLESDGYEFIGVTLDSEKQIESYTFKLKKDSAEQLDNNNE